MRAPARRALAIGSVAVVLFILVVAAAASALVLYGSYAQTRQVGAAGSNVTETTNGNGQSYLMAHLYVNVALNVTVQKSAQDPTVVAKVYQPHDLIVNNFFNYFKSMFLSAASSQITTVSLTDTSNTVDTPNMWNGNPNQNQYGIGWTSIGGGGLIEVGTSNTAPARSDFQLSAPYQTFFTAISAGLCTTGASSSSIIISGSENAQSSATIQEAGLFSKFDSISSSVATYMFAHDTFAGVAVTTANVITISYTWTLNSAGLNRNLCNYLSGLFNNVNFGTTPGLTGSTSVREPAGSDVLFMTGGANVTWAVHCQPSSTVWALGPLNPLPSSSPSTAGCNANGWTSSLSQAVTIAVGTGTTAFTPSSNALNTFNHQSVTTLTTYDGAGNLFITGANVLPSSATISEAAVYITLPQGCEGYSPRASSGAGSCTGGYVTLTTMWMAATFTGVSVTGNNPIGIYFEISG